MLYNKNFDIVICQMSLNYIGRNRHEYDQIPIRDNN